MSDFFDFTERYLSTDGKEYIDVDCVREALGIKEDENIFLAIKRERDLYRTEIDNLKDNIRIKNNALKTVKKERDELKDRVRSLRIQANSVYGAGCGYSEYTGDKAPAFLCNVISYSWNFGALDTPFSSQSIRVELDLTPTASYKGTIDMEDLKCYIQNYGREKKLGVVESIDYQNAKAARAELAYLYKQVLGKEKLDRDLSPHEVMKAILDAVKKLRDAQFASDQCLRSVYMHVYEGTGYKTSDIYAAPDKIADWIITRYDSTKKLSHMETLCDINDFIDKLCDKYNVVQPERSKTTRERLDYIFSVLCDYRSVVDDEWDGRLSYTSALNDINEEYKRVVHNFEERTADWSEVQKEYSRYRLAVNSLLDIPKDIRDDINAIERSFTFSKKQYESLKEFRDNVCDALNMPTTVIDGNIIGRIHLMQDRCDKLARLRSDICTTLCLGCETYDEDILKRVRMTKDCHDALCKDYTKLHDDYIASQKQVKGFTNRCDSLEDLQRDLWELRRNAIEDLKSRGFFFRLEENETLPEIYTKLLKRYDDCFSRYKEQYRLRQQWHVRYESEHERANCVQKALDREREKCRVKDISLETAKKQYEKVCGNLETAECALNGMKSKVRELREENAGLKKDVASRSLALTPGTSSTTLTGDNSVDLYEE